MIGHANKFAELKARRVNLLSLFGFIGDSKATGGVVAQPGGWDSKYEQVSNKSLILYRDNRTTGNQTTLRFLQYNPHENRFPGYGVVNDVGAGNYAVGFDNSLMWYMRENSGRCIGLLKWGLGGTTLLARAGADNDWGLSTNEMYRYFVVDYANLAHQRAKEAGYLGTEMKGIFVSLGTNDCFTGIWNNSAFIAALLAFVNALRAVFGKATLPIYWLQVRSDLSSHPSGDYTVTSVTECRAAIVAFASSDPNFIVLDYEATTTTIDGVHEDADSCEEIGLALGALFVGL